MNHMLIKRVLLFAFLAAAAGWLATYRGQVDIEVLEQWIGNAGLFGAVIFTLLFAATTVLLVPGLIFTLAGGVLFGPILGTVLNLIGATTGAGIAFLIARFIGADWVEEKSRGRIKSIIKGVEAEGWRFVAFVRLVPIFPFFLLNYALGFTRIGFSSYLTTTFVSLIPSVSGITYLGYAGREAMGNGEAMVQKILIAVGLTAVLVFLPYFTKKWWVKDTSKLSKVLKTEGD